MSRSSSRMPGASMRNRTGGHGPPRSGRTTNVSIAPSLVAMSSVCSIIGSSPGLFVAGDRVGEVEDVLVAERREHIAHAGVVAPPRIRLVLAQGLDQVVLTLRGDPRHVVGAGEIRAMTEEAAVLLQQGSGVL